MGFLPFLSPVSELAKTIIDKIFPPKADPTEKLKAEHELAMILEQREATLVSATREIIVAEMTQGDSFTKRARPSIVYSGLLFIFLVHVALPGYAFFSGQPTPDLSLPAEFWWAWTGVVSVWTFGRSMEKRGHTDKITKMITGG
jgi:hypothetical protein